jgi:hypothetical protein
MPSEEKPFGAYAIDAAEERYLKRLSPELQDKIRKLNQIPLLPEWPGTTRGVPNLCLRSALFRVVRRGARRAVKGETIASVAGLNIRYTGWQLDQGDFDVLAQAFHLQSSQRHMEKIYLEYINFRIKSFLRSIGRQPGKSGREWLKESFRRLTATAIEIDIEIRHTLTNEAFAYAGPLIDEFIHSEREQTYSLKINPRLAELFNAGWTQIQWHQRLRLKTDLAKWLHGFYASHKEPYSIKVITLKILCGSNCHRLVDFRRSLRMAMDELVNVAAILAWRIDTQDKMHVQRSPKITNSTTDLQRGGALTQGRQNSRT